MAVADSWEEKTSAAKAKPKPKPPRKPEQVWYDVHKHPEGTPGGMGLSPEHHLRNRGWSGHEINGSTSKTIQYRNHKHPDFVISYGGGSSTKPDHNFRVLYMGTNSNVPKVHRAFSVAEAMNKVEELHKLDSGLVVQPMTHDSAAPTATKPAVAKQPNVADNKTFVAPVTPPSQRDMNDDDHHPIGKIKFDFPTQPDKESDWAKPKPQLKEIPDPPPIKAPAVPKYAKNTHGTLTGRSRHRAASEASCPLCKKAGQVYARDPGLYRELVQDGGGLTREHLRVTSHLHDRVQQALVPRALVVRGAEEEPKDYYHGTTEEDLSEVSPATSHRRGVIFPHQTDPEYGYATPSESNAWHYAELAWNATDHGIPRVYRVRPTGPIEEDPTHWPNGESRGNFSDDVRSRHPFEVHEELPTPEQWQRDEDEDWED